MANVSLNNKAEEVRGTYCILYLTCTALPTYTYLYFDSFKPSQTVLVFQVQIR